MNITYSQRLSLLYGICLAEAQHEAGLDPQTLQSKKLEEYAPLEAATYLACAITVKAIRHAERSPVDEREFNFDMLSVYQAFAMLVYTYLTLPLAEENIAPDFVKASVTIVKSIFAESGEEEWAEIIESGTHKFQLIGDAEQEHWMNYRQDLDKAAIAFVVAGTDENTPYEKEDLIPLFSALLSLLCEAFAND
ncbi:MAG: hypothetical protein ABL885_07450 [Methylophilaceae bacterium]